MSDLISRQAILKNIEKIRQGVQMMDNTYRAGIVMSGMNLCEKAVMNQPSAQPERKKGKWIKHIDDLFPAESTLECNVCHHEQPITIDDNFCPYCGADMRGEQDEADYRKE